MPKIYVRVGEEDKVREPLKKEDVSRCEQIKPEDIVKFDGKMVQYRFGVIGEYREAVKEDVYIEGVLRWCGKFYTRNFNGGIVE